MAQLLLSSLLFSSTDIRVWFSVHLADDYPSALGGSVCFRALVFVPVNPECSQPATNSRKQHRSHERIRSLVSCRVAGSRSSVHPSFLSTACASFVGLGYISVATVSLQHKSPASSSGSSRAGGY